MRQAATFLLAVFLAALGAAGASAQDQKPEPTPAPQLPKPVTPAEIDQALTRALEWCLAIQKDNGGWGGDQEPYGKGNDWHHAADVLGLLALAYCQVDADDPKVEKALTFVLGADLSSASSYAYRVLALSKFHPQLKSKQQALVRQAVANDVRHLVDTQVPRTGGWDSFCETLYGHDECAAPLIQVLAFDEAENVLGPTLGCDPRKTGALWNGLAKRILDVQRGDGGWGYGYVGHAEADSVGSGTAGAVAALCTIREKLYGPAGCPCKGGRSRKVQEAAALDQAVERGLQWLDKNFVWQREPGRQYTFYEWHFWLQKAALATGRKYFNSQDWHRTLVPKMLGLRVADGGWNWQLPTFPMYPFAFLAEARGHVLVNKLQFKGQWNNHPSDLAHLMDYLSQPRKGDAPPKDAPPDQAELLRWQALDLDGAPDDWREAPILFITPEEVIPLADEHKKKLRRFTDAGGTILFEASCGNSGVAAWWERTCGEVWPEWKLKSLEAGHPLWSAEVKLGARPPLLALDDGLRTFMFFSRVDVSCQWSLNDTAKNRPLFDLGRNLYAYSTDTMKLADWWSARQRGVGAKYADQVKNLRVGPKKTIAVARVKYGDGKTSDEWNLGENYQPWQLLAAELKEKLANPTAKVLWKEPTEIALKVLDPVAVGAAVPAETDLLYLCGRTGCDLGEGGAKWLKDYLAGGGFLLAEAALGDARFEAPLKAALSAANLTVKPMLEALKEAGLTDNPLLTGKLLKEARGYEVGQVEFSPALASELGANVAQTPPALWAICDGQRLVGIYSPYDLLFSQTGCRAWGMRGYSADDARALATNLVLHLTGRQARDAAGQADR